MATLQFYDKPVAINKDSHKDATIAPLSGDYSFAANTNSVILAGIEMAEAAKEYPIVFTKAGDKMIPVALMGLRNDENLFVDDEGKWDARYVPAFVRRYPFVLAQVSDAGDMAVCIDESYSGLNSEDGEKLFDDEGEYSTTLKHAIDFLGEYQRQYARTEAFVKRLEDLDLFVELTASVKLKSGQEFALAGLQVIDEKKLLQLDADKAMPLFSAGELAWVYAHLLSLGNMARLVDGLSVRTNDESVDEEETSVH